MLKITIVVLLLLYLQPAAAQKPKKKNAPPGTFQLNDSVCMDTYPVSNADYYQFLQSVRTFWNHAFSDSINQLKDMKMDISLVQLKLRYKHQWHFNQRSLIDSMQVQQQPYKFLEPGLSLYQYLLHPQIRDYPVLGVTIEQAITYCRWRTDMVRILYARRNNTERRQERHFQFIEYRLPEAVHWKTAYEQKGETGKLLMNMLPADEDRTRHVFKVYPYPAVEWMHPADTILKYTITPRGNIFNMTTPPKEALNMQMGFRCSCRVR